MKESLAMTPTLQELFSYPDNSRVLGWWIDRYADMLENTLDCHWHQAIEFDIVLSGEVSYLINGQPVTLTTGDGIFINSGTLHTSMSSTDAVTAVLAVEPEVFPELLREQLANAYLTAPILARVLHKDAKCDQQVLETLAAAYLDRESVLKSLSWFFKLWEIATIPPSADRYHLLKADSKEHHASSTKNVLDYIAAHYAEQLTIETICAATGITRAECFACFDRFTTKAPNRFIIDFRLSQAARLLKTTAEAITDVARACGFNSSGYFIQQFKRSYGQTPKQYQIKYAKIHKTRSNH